MPGLNKRSRDSDKKNTKYLYLDCVILPFMSKYYMIYFPTSLFLHLTRLAIAQIHSLQSCLVCIWFVFQKCVDSQLTTQLTTGECEIFFNLFQFV